MAVVGHSPRRVSLRLRNGAVDWVRVPHNVGNGFVTCQLLHSPNIQACMTRRVANRQRYPGRLTLNPDRC